jgi:AraC-like DNA-binding protein
MFDTLLNDGIITQPADGVWYLAPEGDGRRKRAAWNSLIASAMEPVVFSPTDWASYSARLEVRGSGSHILSLVQTGPWKASTTAEHLSAPGSRSTFILFVVAGSLAINQEGQRATARAGEICFVDGERLARIGSVSTARFFSLRLQSDASEVQMLRSTGQASPVLRRSDPSSKVLLELARSIWSALPHLGEDASAGLIARLRQVATLSLCAVDPAHVQLTPHRVAMLSRAQDLIRRRVTDPNFSPGLLAAEMKIGRRHLNQLFDGLGETPSDYIRRLRTHIAWDLLQDPRQNASINQVAQTAGYGDQALFSRAIRSEFGATPTQIRRMCDSISFELEAIERGDPLTAAAVHDLSKTPSNLLMSGGLSTGA